MLQYFENLFGDFKAEYSDIYDQTIQLSGIYLAEMLLLCTKNMSKMFNNCEKVKILNLTNFETSNVVDMSSMFSGCSQLAMLDVSNFNTGEVTNMASMFKNCELLKDINVANFNTENVIDISSMIENLKH